MAASPRVVGWSAAAAAAAPLAYAAYSWIVARGAINPLPALAVGAVGPFAAGALVVGAWRRDEGARVSGFIGGALGGALVFVFLLVVASASGGTTDAVSLALASVVIVTAGAFFTGVGGLAAHALLGGEPARGPSVPAARTRAIEGRCGTCGARLTPHALQCAQCGAWTDG